VPLGRRTGESERSLLAAIRSVSYHNCVVTVHQRPRCRDRAGTGNGLVPRRRGRPRSARADRAILEAFRELLTEEGFAGVRLEHVAARAGVSKATIYRRWPSKEALAQQLLGDLATPHIAVADTDDTRSELLAAVVNPLGAVTETPFGPVIRALLSQIATNARLGDAFRTTVVRARRGEVARIISRGIARGDLRPDADIDIATELLVGPVYFRLMFGGELSLDFAKRVVDSVMRGYESQREPNET
jgi:AcrR family transcriptional regulator